MRRSYGTSSATTMVLRLSCVLLGISLAVLSLPAQTPSEYNVEAAYLSNFGKFVRWPADTVAHASSFDICILGKDPFRGTLDKLIANDKIDGKPIHKRIISQPSEAAGCAIIYITDSEAENLRKTVAALSVRRQLLVSGLPNFIRDGGMIQFVFNGDRVRFAVNLDPASKSHLVLGSQLLRVAVSVIGKPQSEVVR
ncbi:MAG: YfiR family protein [Acidobacteriaceae bacterium]